MLIIKLLLGYGKPKIKINTKVIMLEYSKSILKGPITKLVVVVVVLLGLVFTSSPVAFAATNMPCTADTTTCNKLSFEVTKCDSTKYNLATYDGFDSCHTDYAAGSLTSYAVANGDKIAAGDYLLVAAYI